MLWYSLPEIAGIVLGAVVLDWIIGDPKAFPHPVVIIGRYIDWYRRHTLDAMEAATAAGEDRPSSRRLLWYGAGLTASTVIGAFAIMLGLAIVAAAIHPWLGYAVHVWFISTTFAVKGLKDAALPVYHALIEGDLSESRRRVGYIVGRDTDGLHESEVSRAAVETVAENTVDAFVSPLVFAVLGGAPLAMAYRAANTLDSMVGYNNKKYMHYGWASARFDDVLNYVPARLSGLCMLAVALWTPGLSAGRAARAVRRFAGRHPSPNSGIPESAVAGALGIELGGTNRYGNRLSERARMGWPLRQLEAEDIRRAIGILYGVSYIWALILALAWGWSLS